MKILIIGGTGTIGQAVVSEFLDHHEVIIAGSKTGDVHVDMEDAASINTMYQQLGKLDAVIVTAGKVEFKPLVQMNENAYRVGINNKLLGQVNVVLIGIPYLNDGGSFTLTSGILNRDPIRLGTSAAMVNGALEGFVKSAAIELPRALRINVVSPTVVAEAMKDYAPYFQGFVPVAASIVAQAYVKSVAGAQTGQIYKAGY